METSPEVQITSLADFISVLHSKDQAWIISVVKQILRDKAKTVLVKYVAAHPTLSHLIDKLLPSILQSTQNEYVQAVMSLLHSTLSVLAVVHASHPATAAQVAKTLLSDCLKPFYRCLSSKAPGLLETVMRALEMLAHLSVDGFVHAFDFSHAGLQDVARMRKRTAKIADDGTGGSPRDAFIRLFLYLIQNADFDSRTSLSKTCMLSYVVDGLASDGEVTILAFLEAVKDRLVFNEEANKNLAITFLKNRQLCKIVHPLLAHKLVSVQQAVAAFLVDCFTKNFEVGNLAFSIGATAIGTVRNRLLLDVVTDFSPVTNETHQQIILATVHSCPDVAWFLLGNRITFDPQATVQYALSVNFMIKLIKALPAVAGVDTIVPKTLNRSNLTRGISHSDCSVKLSTGMLLVAILQRLSTGITGEEQQVAISLLPDARTIYNIWKTNVFTSETEEEQLFLDICCMEVVYYYHQCLGLANLVEDTVKMVDFSKAATGIEASSSAILKLLGVLDPIALLVDDAAVEQVKLILVRSQSVAPAETARLLRSWILAAGLTENEQVANFVALSPKFHQQVAQAIYDFHRIPLVYSNDCDPLLAYLAVDSEVAASALATVALEASGAAVSAPAATAEQLNGKVHPAKAPMDIDDIRSMVDASGAINLLNSAINLAKRKAVFSSYATIDSLAIKFNHPSSLDCLLKDLLERYVPATWIHLMAAAFDDREVLDITIDVRLLLERGILGYAIIGLSANDLEMRRVCHFVLHEFICQMGASRIKERRQVAMVMTALASHSTIADPLIQLPRLTVYLHALAMPVMLRPDHSCYRILNELYLATPIVNPQDAFSRLFWDTNDNWERGVYWILLWLEAALGIDGAYIDDCNLEFLFVAENVSTLMQCKGVEAATRLLALRLLQAINSKVARPWISTTIEFIEKNRPLADN